MKLFSSVFHPKALRIQASPTGRRSAGLLGVALWGGILGLGTVGAQAAAFLTVRGTAGRVEIQETGNLWRSQVGIPSVALGLRTGTGRAVLQSGTGQIVVGSASRLRTYQEEADLLEGQFFLQGPVTVHVQGNHLFVDGGGRVRVDLAPGGSTLRVAVIGGSGRVALGTRIINMQAGQQIALKTGQLSAFRETDPWYAAQFRGAGAATVEATRGGVRIFRGEAAPVNATIGDDLAAGERLTTETNAWAEVGFTGGGYLRLTEQSELSVIAIDKTAQGREVTLQLLRGSAWNVVEKGQGGYKITTPVISTAVRGTVFRVDASGLVKVFEGQVALPSDQDATVSQGQQIQQGSQVEPLTPDALDAFNLARDAERAQPLIFRLDPTPASLRELALSAHSLPDATVTATIAGRTVNLSAAAGTQGLFQLERLQDTLPEGDYAVQVKATRFGQTAMQTRRIRLDRTAPALSGLRVSIKGRILTLTGQVSDAGTTQPLLTVTLGNLSYSRHVQGSFSLLLPVADPALPIRVSVQDQAGNESHAALP
ncbi:FecR family protein [Deinococcus aquatilis]|uniref:FecR family protein n=1 Tax=Deinococcus aquatilis TaxID=519440 RepID=UPI0012F77D97|nr:FecR family protein [Deinococcus aquatilis]